MFDNELVQAPFNMTSPFSFVLVLLAMFCLCEANMDSWPQGQYGLLKPQTGCPLGWPQKTGWIYQDTEDTNPSNNHSQLLHIEGRVGASYVLRSFCMKTDSSGTKWPEGQYCVYNKYFSNCPDSGLLTGNIRWDDENTNNKNALKTPLPYYDNYNKNLRLAFCCSTTGSKSTPIQLPISRAFYLLPYGSAKCQLVEWMVASLEWISYDKEDTGTDYSKQVGSLPYYTLNDKRDITMYYCYYQSCNYTLNSSKGSFKSPGYLNSYTVGQRCSWKISAPINHTILVTFSMATSDGNDTLEYFTKRNGSYELVRRYHGNDASHDLMSESNDVMFVFLSDVENTSRGFRAEYEVIPTEDLYTTAKTTLLPTTLTTPTKFESTEHASTVTPSQPTATNSENISPEKAAGHGDKLTILLIVIPLVCLVLVVVVVVDIWYRCRHRKCKHEDEKVQLSPDMAVNDIYECEMIVSQCRTITRPSEHQTHLHDNREDVYQNTNEGYYSDETPNSNKNTPTHPTLPKTASQPNDYYFDHLGDNAEAFNRKELSPRDNAETEYSYVGSPRVVSGEYGYIQPLEYVPRNDTDDISICRNGSDTKIHNENPKRDRNDSDASYLEPLECVNDGSHGNTSHDVTAVNADIDEPIYEYDNACEPLGDDQDIYANIN